MFDRYLSIISELQKLSGKWFFCILVILLLCERTNFNQLRKIMRPITPKVLSRYLKQFEELGLVMRNVLIEKPLRVEYYLTEKGKMIAQSLLDALDIKKITGYFSFPQK